MGQYTKLRVFTKADETSVSTIYAPHHRKIFVSTLPKKRPPKSVWTLFIQPCSSHTDSAPSLWLDTFGPRINPDDIFSNHLGKRKYCILCWTPISELLKNDSGTEEIVQDKGDVEKPQDIEV